MKMSLGTRLLMIVLALTLFPGSAAAELDNQGLSPAGLTVAQLSTAAPVQMLEDYDAQSDPEHLLGRPGQYLAKATMNDSSIDQYHGVTGIVEVFSTEAALDARLNALSARGELDVPVGSILLRLVPNTPATTVTAYQSALSSFAFR